MSTGYSSQKYIAGAFHNRSHPQQKKKGNEVAYSNLCFTLRTKNPNPSPIGKKFGFCCCGAPPGTRTLGPLIKRNQRATIVNFQNYADSLFLSLYRKFAFCICCILCACHSLLHPLSSRSGVQKVCKNVQS